MKNFLRNFLVATYTLLPTHFLGNEAQQTVHSLQKKIEISNNNEHQFIQNVTLNAEKRDPTDCSALTGQSLRDCMTCQSAENFKKNLINFNDRMARNYLLSLTPAEMNEVIKTFSPEDWKIFYNSRSSKFLFPEIIHLTRFSGIVRSYMINLIAQHYTHAQFVSLMRDYEVHKNILFNTYPGTKDNR